MVHTPEHSIDVVTAAVLGQELQRSLVARPPRGRGRAVERKWVTE